MKALWVLSLLFVATVGGKTEARCIECEREVKRELEKLKKDTKDMSQTLTALIQIIDTISVENNQLSQQLTECRSNRASGSGQ